MEVPTQTFCQITIDGKTLLQHMEPLVAQLECKK